MSAKMTLLEMVQDIMSDLDSDEVTSINDTVESMQVARVLKQVYIQMCGNQLIPEHQQLMALSAVSLVTYPSSKNYMSLPDTVQEMEWLKYNKKLSGATDEAFGDIKYLCPKSFMDLVSTNLSSDTNCTHVVDPTSSVGYYVRNDLAPEWWTSFDDLYIAFSSWDTAIDTLQIDATKSLTLASVVPVWTVSDTFTPAIDDNLFPFLVAEAKSTCFVNLKQVENKKVDKQARQQRVAIQNRKFRTRSSEEGSVGAPSGPNYGRRTIR